ncbi:TPA: phage/plasmid primase, P4 family [Clostridioides difficile]|uniref:DNA primase family protein n=1 Tax=Clostridioides difficile TaxID=1496 RepID=UPI000980027E|nr:DNA primase family protein [Clostridioides difficile]MDV9473497.1 phage/plasmid primase, P4 family [Clostridioides difficile]MDV9929414.1 phage/plasmid primase, P4 family [Clostridioides difficile]MDV9989192.1 phage/plasmid primase, P4 family [Clostridioides difficile]SJO94578.1 phage/plasmid primase, P4 family, C-terminal domain [Clostridioides difficile]HBE8912102.1 DNA primase [Clostridioides difficile]
MSFDIFKGYIITNNKKAAEKFKNVKKLKTYEQIKNLPEFAGVLAEETVLVDIDDFESSEILYKIVQDLKLKCRVYKTTRGKHFLFKNTSLEKNRTKCRLAIGLNSDIKLGCKNSYSILKFNNIEREILYDSKEIQEIPTYLTPIKNGLDFLSLGEGDGRNQALYNYILTLQSNDFTIEEIRETIRVINKYVLKTPLQDNELEVILRDESFQKKIFFNSKGSFLFDEFAKYIKNNNHVIKINEQLHLYKDGIYVDGQARIEAEMINNISNLNKAKRSEVLSYLNLLISENTSMSEANLIAFKNGIYNIVDDSFIEFSPEFIITNKVNWNYNPGAYSKLVDKTMNKLSCGDFEIRMLLEEVVGYCFYRRNELRKAFILTGDKANGKSTYLDMIKTLLGDENTSALDLKELSDRFKTAELFGKLANIGDDIGDEFIANPAIFKKLVSGDRVNVERKGQNPFDFNNYSKFLFSANNIPRIKDKTGAVLDRLIIIPFNASFSVNDKDFDPYIKYKLREQEAIEYLINLGLEGLKRVLKNRKFTVPDKVKKEILEYEEVNNPILGFFKEVDKIENESTKEIYMKYQEYCILNGLQPISNVEFSRQVVKKFGYEIKDKKINGKKYRVFINGSR